MGATTAVGRKCLLRLLRHNAYAKIILLLEEPLDFQHPRLEVYPITFERLPDFQQHMAVADVFYTWTHQMQIKDDFGAYRPRKTYAWQLARLARQMGAQQFFLLSSSSADQDSFLHFQPERKMLEEAIKSLDFWSTHIFRPGPLLDEKPDYRWNRVFQNVRNKLSDWTALKWDNYQPIAADELARVMIEKAQQFKAGVHLYSALDLSNIAAPK